MLNLKELFKKRPFIYYIDGEYYALGAGVCSCCCSKGTYLTLPKKYEDYLKIVQSILMRHGKYIENYHQLQT